MKNKIPVESYEVPMDKVPSWLFPCALHGSHIISSESVTSCDELEEFLNNLPTSEKDDIK